MSDFTLIRHAPARGPFEETATPEGLHWDMWVGPAQEAPYMVERRKEFRWFLEYSGGKMTDWASKSCMQIARQLLGTGPTTQK